MIYISEEFILLFFFFQIADNLIIDRTRFYIMLVPQISIRPQLLYAINGGIDEKTKMQVGPEYTPITSEYLDYDEVIKK